MTLIAAFKCSDGFLVCADSQETCGHYKTRVDKIKPQVCGNFQIAIAGSGPSAVVDDCTLKLERAVGSLASNKLADLEECMHSNLLDFRKNECTAADRRQLKFIVCALAANDADRSHQVWLTAGSRLNPVDTFAVSGWETEMYQHTAERLYRPRMLINQAVFAALYLLRLAGETSQYIGGPTKLVAVRRSGMWPYSPDYTHGLSERMDIFAKQVDSLLLFCPDTSISKAEFSAKLQEFGETIATLRQDYLQEAAEAMLQGELYPMLPDRMRMEATPSGRTEFTEDDKPRIMPKK